MTVLTFLGTGNYVAPGRYWNSFVVDGTVLMEPSPSCLPNLRRAGIAAAAIDTIFISHFHFSQATYRALGGTSVLIVVGVALQTMRQMESQMVMRHYEGFLR